MNGFEMFRTVSSEAMFAVATGLSMKDMHGVFQDGRVDWCKARLSEHINDASPLSRLLDQRAILF